MFGSIGTILVVAAITFIFLYQHNSVFIGAGITPATPKKKPQVGAGGSAKKGVTIQKKPVATKKTSSGSSGAGAGSKSKSSSKPAPKARVTLKPGITPATPLEGITAARLKLTIPPPPTSLVDFVRACTRSNGTVEGGNCRDKATGRLMTKDQRLKAWYRYKMEPQAETVVAPYRRAELQRLATANGYANAQEMISAQAYTGTTYYKVKTVMNKYNRMKLTMINNALATVGVTPILSIEKNKNGNFTDPVSPETVTRSAADPSSGAEYAV